MTKITIAVAKGYLLKKAIERFTELGYEFSYDILTTRQLVVEDRTQLIRLLLVRPWDVPVYVSQGAADLGIVGQDILHEQTPNVLILSDLKFGKVMGFSSIKKLILFAMEFVFCINGFKLFISR